MKRNGHEVVSAILAGLTAPQRARLDRALGEALAAGQTHGDLGALVDAVKTAPPLPVELPNSLFSRRDASTEKGCADAYAALLEADSLDDYRRQEREAEALMAGGMGRNDAWARVLTQTRANKEQQGANKPANSVSRFAGLRFRKGGRNQEN